jgi:hypothetical protein
VIYIIIGTDNNTGNQWVEAQTFEKSLDAAERCMILNTLNDNAVYRVDTVTSKEEKKLLLSSVYGKQAGDTIHNIQERLQGDPYVQSDYQDSDSISELPPRPADYTLTELFGMYAKIPANADITTAESLVCRECGAMVLLPQSHVDFHNKLLP